MLDFQILSYLIKCPQPVSNIMSNIVGRNFYNL